MRHYRYRLAFSASFLAILSTPSHGQTAQGSDSSPAEPDGALTEIIVTAQKRSERLSDVPASISVVGGEELRQGHITNASDLVQLVPNLQANGGIGANQPIYSIRGVSMNDYSLNQSAPIATYYDEVYKGNVALLGLVYYDLDRVEVLRGPQGTLYGKNATGGAINLIAQAPKFDTEGYFNVTGGNYDRFEAQGAFQTPISDTLAARVAFTVARADGWFKDILPGQPNQNQTRYWGGRMTLLWEPGDKFSATLRLSTSDEDPIHSGVYAQPGANGIGAGVYSLYHSLDPVSNPNVDYFPPAGASKRSDASGYVNRDQNRTYSAALTSKYEVSDALELTSITSYDRGLLAFQEDADGSPLRVYEFGAYDRARQFTQDLRLSSKGSAPFQFLVGGFYSNEATFDVADQGLYLDVDANLDGKLDHNDCLAAFPIGCTIQNSFNQKKASSAVYSDGSYKLTDELTLRGGGRFTHDTASLSDFGSRAYGTDGVLVMNLIPGSETDLNATTGRDFTTNNVSGKAGIDFKPNTDTLLYAVVSRGYRGGSFNGQAFFSPEELTITKPEIVTAYEGGTKSTLFNHRLQVNVAGFYYNYENQQFIDVDPKTAAQPLVNLPKSRILGAEIEILAKPVNNVKISGGAGYLDTKILEGTLSGQSVRGNSIVNAPPFSGRAAIDWDVASGSWGMFSVQLDGSYTGKQYFDLQNRPTTTQGAYALANARLSWRSASDRFGVDLWMRNITDTFYTTYKIDVLSAFGFVYNRVGDPRTYGATLSAKF